MIRIAIAVSIAMIDVILRKKREKRCFGNCCGEAANAYALFYRSLGEKSLAAIDPIAKQIYRVLGIKLPQGVMRLSQAD